MKRLAAISLILSAAPVWAHDGLHLHPHADHSSWLPLLAGSLAIGTAALIAWARK